jgi:hypothetical protein
MYNKPNSTLVKMMVSSAKVDEALVISILKEKLPMNSFTVTTTEKAYYYDIQMTYPTGFTELIEVKRDNRAVTSNCVYIEMATWDGEDSGLIKCAQAGVSVVVFLVGNVAHFYDLPKLLKLAKKHGSVFATRPNANGNGNGKGTSGLVTPMDCLVEALHFSEKIESKKKLKVTRRIKLNYARKLRISPA